MKKYMVVMAAITFVIAMVSGAWAAGSVAPSVTATGTVASICTSATGGNINFSIDPSVAGPITPATVDSGNTAPTVKCTNAASPTVTCTSAHSYNLTIGNDGITDPIAYTITGCPANISGQGFSTAVPIDFGLSLAQTDYQDALAGDHIDTITVTVNY
jgi:hypothetical protein